MLKTAVIALTVACGAGSALANYVFFESFESLQTRNFVQVNAPSTLTTDVATWVVSAGSIDYVWVNLPGRRIIELDGEIVIDTYGVSAGSMSTTIEVVEGLEYSFEFLYSLNPDSSAASLGFEIEGAQLLLDGTVSETSANEFVPRVYEGTFVADTDEITVNFSAGVSQHPWGGVTIDAIGIKQVPVPGAAAMIVVGGVVATRRRR